MKTRKLRIISILAFYAIVHAIGSSAAEQLQPAEYTVSSGALEVQEIRWEGTSNRSELMIGHRLAIAQQYPINQYPTTRCYTPAGVCLLPVAIPAGSGCYCNTPYGPVGGVAR
jgi:hypothetical protein